MESIARADPGLWRGRHRTRGVSTRIKAATFTDPDPVVNGLDFSATVTAESGSATFSDPTIEEEGNGEYDVVVTGNDSDAETVKVCVDIDPLSGEPATVESNADFVQAAPGLTVIPGPVARGLYGQFYWPSQWQVTGRNKGGLFKK